MKLCNKLKFDMHRPASHLHFFFFHATPPPHSLSLSYKLKYASLIFVCTIMIFHGRFHDAYSTIVACNLFIHQNKFKIPQRTHQAECCETIFFEWGIRARQAACNIQKPSASYFYRARHSFYSDLLICSRFNEVHTIFTNFVCVCLYSIYFFFFCSLQPATDQRHRYIAREQQEKFKYKENINSLV